MCLVSRYSSRVKRAAGPLDPGDPRTLAAQTRIIGMDLGLYEEQLAQWKKEDLSAAQRQEWSGSLASSKSCAVSWTRSYDWPRSSSVG